MGRGSEYNFATNTFIFGRNARGKSTLTAILESLKSGNPDPIVGRKTFGVSEGQEIEIQFVDISGAQVSYKFSGDLWDKINPNVLIFDNKFIAKNVYSDDVVTSDQEDAILAVILGGKGRTLDDAWRTAEENLKTSSNRKTEITREFNRHLGVLHKVELKYFLKIIQDSDIEKKIKDNADQIKAQESIQQIKNKLSTFRTKLQNLNLDGWEVKLVLTIRSSQDLVKKHILEHMRSSDDAKRFLSEGLDQMLEKQGGQPRNCVFCGQPLSLDAETLLANYAELFSEQYKNLVNAVDTAHKVLEGWSLAHDIEVLVDDLKALGVTLNLNDKAVRIEGNVSSLKEEMEAKRVNLEHKFDTDKLKPVLAPVNEIIEYIEELEKQYSTPDSIILQKLNQTKSMLELGKKRYEVPWVNDCAEYQQLEANSKALTEVRSRALEAKNQYAETILEQHETEINKILGYLTANFKLVDLKPKQGVRQTGRLFGIVFDNQHNVSLDSNNRVPAFNNTLSDSDKRMLAFAFFMARVKGDSDLKDKILIMDDPMSSLDEERRRKTVMLLNDLMGSSERPIQLVILTHDKIFLSFLWKEFADRRAFRLDSASIEPMVPGEEWLDSYYKDLENLRSLYDGSEDKIMVDGIKPIRRILERVVKTKYYPELQGDIASGAGLGRFMDVLVDDKKIYDDSMRKRINSLLANLFNHDDGTSVISHGDLSPGDLKSILSDFFAILRDL